MSATARRRRRTAIHPDIPRNVIEYCWWWWTRTYVKDITSSAQMNLRVEALLRNHIEPWLRELDVQTWDELHPLDVDDLSFQLAGMISHPNEENSLRLIQTDFYTAQEAATLGKCGISKVKHLSAAGKFPNRKLVLLDGETRERYMIPAEDLTANGWDLRHGTPLADQRTAGPVLESTGNEILQLLRRICDDAVRNGVIDRNPAAGVQAKAPSEEHARRSSGPNRERILTWTECTHMATFMSVHDQLAMWLGRGLGLRIGEVFGLNADDFRMQDGDTLVTIRFQSGKDHDVRAADGTIIKVRRVPVKTIYSVRTLVVPASLVAFINVYINAFHRQSDGSIPKSTPLVIGIREPERASIGSYAARLRSIGRSLGIVVDVDEEHNPATHTMRRAFSGDIRQNGLASDVRLSEILGHAPTSVSGGAEVTMRHYTPAPSDLAPSIAAFNGIDRLIHEEIGSLFVATTVEPHWGRNNPIRDRLDTGREMFAEHWTTPGESTEPAVLDSSEAAAYLGIARTTMVTHCRRGKAPGAYRALSAGQQVWYIPLATLEQLKAQSDDTFSIGEVAEQTGLGYIEIWRRIDHGKLAATQGASNEFRIHIDELPALKVIARQRAATESRSMTLARAARALRMQHKTARQLLDSGELVRDHNPTGNGWIYVTNESVAAAVKHRQRRMRGRRLDESGLIEIQVAADRSGRTRAELQELVRAGVLQRVQKSGKTYLREQGLNELVEQD